MMIQPRRLIASISALGATLALLMVGFVWLVANVAVTHADPGTIIVATTGVDDADCGTEADPCRTIPYAATKAVAGDVVFVWPGTYLEQVTMKAGVVISGTTAAVTIIDGENARGPMVSAVGSTIGRSSVLRGFTIQRGYIATRGAGLSIRTGASPTIEDCIVRDNLAGFYGGGMYIEASSPLISDTLITGNVGVRGGGLYIYNNSAPIIHGVELRNNHATGAVVPDGGGGLYNQASSPQIDSTEVVNNSTARDGGGIYSDRALDITSLRLAANSAAYNGGGAYAGDSLTLVSSEVMSNTAGATGGGLYVAGNAILTGTQVCINTATDHGGGLYGLSTVILTQTQIISNTSARGGGGLFQRGTTGQVRVTGSRFERNVARTLRGGGLHADGNATVHDTLFISNTTATYGGGLSVSGSATLTKIEAVNNTAAESGGGLYGVSTVQVTNSLFAGNVAPDGAGIHLRGSSGMQTLHHLTVTSDGVNSGSAIYVYGGNVDIANTIITRHAVGIRQTGGILSEDYNLYFGNGTDIVQTSGTLNPGSHSLHGQDPAFVDPAKGDYHIGTGSAALDLGAFLGVTGDLDGDNRPTNAAQPDAPDIGCDENRSLTVERSIADTMTFGAACARIVFTDTGGLTGITVTVVYTYPTQQLANRPLPRHYLVTTQGAGPYTARLSVCYTDEEFLRSDVTDEEELRLYRDSGTNWVSYPSTVNTTGNVVTASQVAAFSRWAISGLDGMPTAVDLDYFAAHPGAGGIRLEWETVSEVDNLGFKVYRAVEATGEPGCLNDSLIPSQAPGSPTGAWYDFLDRSAGPGIVYYYWLESVDVYGETMRYGPVSAVLPRFAYYLPLVQY